MGLEESSPMCLGYLIYEEFMSSVSRAPEDRYVKTCENTHHGRALELLLLEKNHFAQHLKCVPIKVSVRVFELPWEQTLACRKPCVWLVRGWGVT